MGDLFYDAVTGRKKEKLLLDASYLPTSIGGYLYLKSKVRAGLARGKKD
jgi:hypothetical protein